MPIGITSPAKNLFLIGSTGAASTQDFISRETPDPTDSYGIRPTDILYEDTDQKIYVSGTQNDSTFATQEGFIYRTAGDEEGLGYDYTLKLQVGDTFGNIRFEALCLDGDLNLYAAGSYDNGNTPIPDVAPTVTKYDNLGQHQWTRSFLTEAGSTEEIRFVDICADTYGNVYALGSGNADTIYIAKYASDGYVMWVRKYTDLDLNSYYAYQATSISINSKSELIIAGTGIGLDKYFSVLFKISEEGEFLWDKTFEHGENPSTNSFVIRDTYVDDNDQIYVTGTNENFLSGNFEGYVLKMTREGNLLWQTKTKETNKEVHFSDISVDSLTGQSIVIGRVFEGGTTEYVLVQRYTNAGNLIWSRKIFANNEADYVSMVADPSYYYLLFADQIFGPSDPESFLFGKLSVTGSGLGSFQYNDGASIQNYEIISINTEVATLRDGSLRNDTSDFITYPHSGIKVLFGDISGGNMIYSDKKPVHETNSHNIKLSVESTTNQSTMPVMADDIVRGNSSILNYDFGNDYTYDYSHNLYPNSTTYGTATWNLQGTNGVTPNTTDVLSPVGDYTATKWQPTTTLVQYIYAGVGSLGLATHTMSVWVRAADGETTTFGMNLFSPTQQPSDFTATDKWQRFTWTFIPQNQSTAYPVIVRELDKALYIWGPQIEKSYVASRYSPTSGSSNAAATTVTNIFASSNTATINGPVFNPAGYFEFDTNEIVRNGFTAHQTTTGTLEWWVKTPIVSLMSNQYYGGVGGTSTFGAMRALRVSNGQWSFANYGSGGSEDWNGIDTPADNSWYHVVYTWNGTSVNAYFNNVNYSTTLSGLTTPNGTVFVLGRAPYGNSDHLGLGLIAEARFYSRVLSAAEVSQNFNATRAKYGV